MKSISCGPQRDNGINKEIARVEISEKRQKKI